MHRHSSALAPFVAALSLGLTSALVGCGQKGPLVMPDTDTSNVVIRPSATPAPPGTPEGNGSPGAPAGGASPPSTPAGNAPSTPPATDDDRTTTPRRDPAPRR